VPASAGGENWTLLRWFRHFKQTMEGAKSADKWLKHLRDVEDAQKRIKNLEELCQRAKGKEAQELRKMLHDEQKELKGHLKEMRQKWPDFMKWWET
jgi:protein subunit release factor A